MRLKLRRRDGTIAYFRINRRSSFTGNVGSDLFRSGESQKVGVCVFVCLVCTVLITYVCTRFVPALLRTVLEVFNPMLFSCVPQRIRRVCCVCVLRDVWVTSLQITKLVHGSMVERQNAAYCRVGEPKQSVSVARL